VGCLRGLTPPARRLHLPRRSRAKGFRMAHKSIIVTVADDALKDIHQVADHLKARGMTVHRVMPVTGVIAGSIAPSKLSALAKVQGVSSVEEEASVQLPPPGSDVQ